MPARPGGYTRIIKLGNRLGDNAETCLIELVDFNELLIAAAAEKATATTKTRRSRRGSGSRPATADEATAPVVAQASTAADTAERLAAEVEETASATSTEGDDLTKIEGIGPKIAELLNNAGITTFAQLADAEMKLFNKYWLKLVLGLMYMMQQPGMNRQPWPVMANGTN